MEDRSTGTATVTMRRLGLLAVVVNVVIVVTGGAVRLTGSGLGCPEWPTCNAGSVVPVPDADVAGWHQAIEYGNRLLSVVVLAVAVAVLVAVVRRHPRRDDVLRPAILMVAGVGLQGVVGGITVLTGLHPLIVAAHFLLSIVLITAAVVLNHRVRHHDAPARLAIRRELRHVERALLVVLAAVLLLGTLVTASGPHAGDPGTPRLGLDPELISRIHADGVFLLLGLIIALWFAVRATPAPPQSRRATTTLLVAALAQGTIGYVQYFTGLPELLVGAHLLGACLVWIAAVNLWLQSHIRAGRQPAAGDRPPEVTATEPASR